MYTTRVSTVSTLLLYNVHRLRVHVLLPARAVSISIEPKHNVRAPVQDVKKPHRSEIFKEPKSPGKILKELLETREPWFGQFWCIMCIFNV